MKRWAFSLIIVLAAASVFAACKKPEVAEPGKTSYTLVSKVDFLALGYDLDAILYEYDAHDGVTDSNNVSSPEYKKQYFFYPDEAVDHVKMKLVSAEGTVRWANQIFYLKKGENVEIAASLRMIVDPDAYCFTEPKP